MKVILKKRRNRDAVKLNNECCDETARQFFYPKNDCYKLDKANFVANTKSNIYSKERLL